jgi:sec-independent protein translocase protein TatC
MTLTPTMQNTEPHKEQPLIEHLLELRTRLLRITLLLVALFLGLLFYANDIYTFVAAPLLAALPEGSQMIATDVASTFLTPVKLVFVLAFFLAIPYILFEIWGFIAPGLFSREKRIALPVLSASIVLFYLGVAFAYYVVFPVMFLFFSMSAPEGVSYTPDIARFLDTILAMFLAFGFTFEIPVATFLLIYSGTVPAHAMQAKRPYIIVACFTIAMFLTPPDPLSQIFMAIPMWLLFESGLLLGRLVKPQAETV